MNFFRNQNDSGTDADKQSKDRLRSLEVKVNLLLTLVLIQIGISLYLAIQTLFPSWTTIVVMILLAGSLCWIFRKQLPSWAGLMTRKLLKRSGKSSDSDSQSTAEKFD